MLLSAIATLLVRDPSAAVAAMTKGSHDAVSLAMQLTALYAFWLGFFGIIERIGLADKLARLLRPVVRFLFPGASDESRKYATMNISANLLGLGNAATPMAIRAIGSMESEADGRASQNMIMMVVISSTSLQLLPTTVIGMRATHGSANPSDFLFACIVATIISTFLGIAGVKLMGLLRRKVFKKRTVANAANSAKNAIKTQNSAKPAEKAQNVPQNAKKTQKTSQNVRGKKANIKKINRGLKKLGRRIGARE